MLGLGIRTIYYPVSRYQGTLVLIHPMFTIADSDCDTRDID